MKRFSALVSTLLASALALTLVSSAMAAADSGPKGHAIVAGVLGSGKAMYSTDNGKTWMSLRVNKALDEGTSIKTEGNVTVDLFVNGISTVRVAKDTEMSIDSLIKGSGPDADSTTKLNLKSGTVLGNVKKLSKASTYSVATPQGVAGIRGTQFVVTAVANGNGGYTVTFSCASGTIVVDATVGVNNGPVQVQKVVLQGQSWTPAQQADPVATAQNVIDDFTIQLQNAINVVLALPGATGLGGTPPPPPPPPPGPGTGSSINGSDQSSTSSGTTGP